MADLDVDARPRDAASQDAANRSGAAEVRGGTRDAAIPTDGGTNFDETAGATSPVRAGESYSQIIEHSGDGPRGISSAAPARDPE